MFLLQIKLFRSKNTNIFTATVYKICIANANGAMKAERVSHDVVTRESFSSADERMFR